MSSSVTAQRLEQIREWFQADLEAEPEIGLTSFQHAGQTAEQACAQGADDDMIVAALLHDVGHAQGGADHGQWARIHLAGWFDERVLWLIEHHITAKRYMCTVQPDYEQILSADSRRTLRLQGGTLSETVVLEFSRHPWFDDVMRLREWDDAAKRGGWEPRPFDEYLILVEQRLDAEIERTRLLRIQASAVSMVRQDPDR